MSIALRFALCTALAAACGSSASANLVANPGFETGDFTGWDVSLNPTGVSVIADGHTGTFSASFVGVTSAQSVIEQQVSVVNGGLYEISFWVLNYGAGDDRLSVFFDGQMVFDETPVGFPLEDWSFVSFQHQVSSPTGDVQFAFGAYDLNASMQIDDVSVTLVPAPGALACAGAAGLLALRRRR